MLLFERGGEDKLHFESHFSLAFQDGLATEGARPLLEWLVRGAVHDH
jgi:hypothetical protein